MAAGDLVRLVPEWYECCNVRAGGPVLIGNPFCAEYSPTGQDLFIPTREDDERSVRYFSRPCGSGRKGPRKACICFGKTCSI